MELVYRWNRREETYFFILSLLEINSNVNIIIQYSKKKLEDLRIKETFAKEKYIIILAKMNFKGIRLNK